MADKDPKDSRRRTWTVTTLSAAEMADPARLHRMAEAFRHNLPGATQNGATAPIPARLSAEDNPE